MPPTCAGCNALDNPDLPRVTLLTGQEVTTWCECWRAECAERAQDVHQVLALPDKDQRHRYLAAYGDNRGPAALERLKEAIMLTHGLRRRAREDDEAAAAGAQGAVA